jgi:phage replication-related protein YjqB (UPF0714/DUF867 family)
LGAVGVAVDRYSSFNELNSDNVNGSDFSITIKNISDRCIIAPHGGKIEVMTSEIAKAVAGEQYALYLFEGIKAKGNRDLHITSHVFDEPSFDKFIKDYQVALGIHGRKDLAEVHGADKCDGETIFISGRNSDLATSLSSELKEAGFKALSSGHKFSARHTNNVCNRAVREGAQIELPMSLRLQLPKNKSMFDSLVLALKKSLQV